VQTAKIFSGDSYVEFRLDTCAESVFKKGKLVHLQHFIRDMEIEEISKKKTNRRLTMYKIHHLKADVDRLYV
jgi:hypothetical protein